VEEVVIRWEFDRPYLIAHGAGGYCVHFDRRSYMCTVWEDFVEMGVNDGMIKQIDDSNEKIYTYQKSNNNRVEE